MNVMDSKRRKQLQALLLELDVHETFHEMNRYLDKKDEENALMMIKVEDAITTLLDYLDR